MPPPIRLDNIRLLSPSAADAALRAHKAMQSWQPAPAWPAVDESWWKAVAADRRQGGAGAVRKVDPELGMALYVDGKYHRFLRAPVIRHVLKFFQINPQGEIVIDPYSPTDFQKLDEMVAGLPIRDEIGADIRWINLCGAVNGQRVRLVGR